MHADLLVLKASAERCPTDVEERLKAGEPQHTSAYVQHTSAYVQHVPERRRGEAKGRRALVQKYKY